jgi:hypothetical protein
VMTGIVVGAAVLDAAVEFGRGDVGVLVWSPHAAASNEPTTSDDKRTWRMRRTPLQGLRAVAL